MKKIGTLKGIPVVEGNVNEVTKNQIHYKESGGEIQLSKRDNDNKLNSITSGYSNGGEGGLKKYYYKTTFPDDYMYNDVYITVKELYILGTRIGKLRAYGITNSFYEYVEVGPETPNVKEIVAIQLIDAIDYLWTYMLENGEHDVIGIIPRGNIVDKFKYVAEEKGISEEEIQPMIDIINSMFQEITKEEYESMITYKPE